MKTTKIDAIKLSPTEQAMLREMIVRQHIKGKSPNEIMEILDVKPGLVYTTIRNYKQGGLDAVKLKVMGRPINSYTVLTPEQEERVH